jgi:hypothetical protein
MKTYECKVCWNVNHVSRLHCATCGTIPAQYSWKGQPIRERENTITSFNPETLSATIDVLVAFGCERQTRLRTVKHMLRTVPMDYYAAE